MKTTTLLTHTMQQSPRFLLIAERSMHLSESQTLREEKTLVRVDDAIHAQRFDCPA